VTDRRRREARGDALHRKDTPVGGPSRQDSSGLGVIPLGAHGSHDGSSMRTHSTLGQSTALPTARSTARPENPRTTEHPTLRPGRGSGRGSGEEALAPPAIPSDLLPAVREASAQGQLALRDESTSQALLIRGSANPPRPAMRVVPRRSGPRSAAAQFAGGMVVMMALLSAVVLATPLGQTAGWSGAFQTYASGIPWIPTPTPTPRPAPSTSIVPPHEADPGKQAIVNEIVAVFGSYAQGALAVASCESGYDPNAWNPYAINGSHASGVFQILYPGTWDGTAYASYSPFNANANIHAAYQIFQRDGYTWREWQCQP
jgi:hypothetical protein